MFASRDRGDARRRRATTCTLSTGLGAEPARRRRPDGRGPRESTPRRVVGPGLPVLGFYRHTDLETRESAEAAGVDLVVPRSRMAREMPELRRLGRLSRTLARAASEGPPVSARAAARRSRASPPTAPSSSAPRAVEASRDRERRSRRPALELRRPARRGRGPDRPRAGRRGRLPGSLDAEPIAARGGPHDRRGPGRDRRAISSVLVAQHELGVARGAVVVHAEHPRRHALAPERHALGVPERGRRVDLARRRAPRRR